MDNAQPLGTQQESIAPIAEAEIASKAKSDQMAESQPSQVTTSNPQVAQVTTEALSSGANPLALAVAKKQLGQSEYIGYCEAFVEHVQGSTTRYPSAIDAWNSQAEQGKAVSGLNGIQPGDAMYFTPNSSNDGYGHTGVYAGIDTNGQQEFISATDNGIQQIPISAWEQATGQQALGYIPKGGQNATQ